MGGTFDIIHSGHKALLQKALEVGDIVLIGLTTDARASKNRNKTQINNYNIRLANLQNLLKSMKSLDKFQIVPLENDWGPSVVDEDFEAIIVSDETKYTAQKINKIRSADGKTELEIVVVPMIRAQDGNRISSSRIRNKEINSEGKIT
jgi:pantetheine-phosphate adenylyltransferase|tara:strand:- start:557 stop:1000 length:444 start_codon:yes stop_codon:yes gene_type:complete